MWLGVSGMFGLLCLHFHLLAYKKHTPKQVMSFEQKNIKNARQVFITLKKPQIMIKYERYFLIEDFKWKIAYLVDIIFKILAFII